MVNVYEANYHYIEEVFIKELIFEKRADRNKVTIVGYHKFGANNKLIVANYFSDFYTLTDLLLCANEEGEPVIAAIIDKLYEEEEADVDDAYPLLLNIENVLHGLLQINNMVLKIYKPKKQNQNGEWEEEKDNHFYIESFVRKEIQPFSMAQSQLPEHLILLESRYNYYLKLVEILPTIMQARKQAGLKNSLLFKIAVANHGLITGMEA